MTLRADHPDIAKALQRVIRATVATYKFCPGSYSMEALAAALSVSEAFEREAAPDWIAAYLDQCGSRCGE